MAEGEVRQYWVRNDRGTLWGPLTLPTIELLIDSGSIRGKLQVSEDGLNFAFPWRFPEVRDALPPELWGPGAPAAPAQAAAGATAPGAEPQAAAPVMTPQAPTAGPGAAPMAGPGAAPMAGPGARPVAGPGAVPAAGPGAMPMAGPGARANADPSRRPAPPPQAQAAARPGVPPGAAPRPPPTVGAAPGAPVPGRPPTAPGVPVGATPVPGQPPTAPGVPVGATPVPGQPPTAPGVPAGATPVPGRPPAAPGVPVGATPVPGRPSAAPQAARPATAPAPPPAAAPTPAPVAAAPTPAVVPAEASPFAMPSQGQLEQHSPLSLYGRIAASEQTGLLTLTLADRVVHIHFRKGNPEFVDSSHPEDALGTSLMGARLLTAEQLPQAEAAKERFGGDLLAALFGLGMLQPASAFAVLAQRASGILFKGLRAESGTFTYEPRELPGHKAMPLGNRWAVLSDTVRRMPPADLKRRLAPVLQLPIMKSGGMVAASELRLTPHEVRALAVIDGVRSVAQLLADFPQDADHLLRLAFLLKELEAVSFAAPTRTTAVSPPPASAATPPPQAGTPAAGPGVAARPPGAAAPGPAAVQPPGAARPPGPTAPAAGAGAAARPPGAVPGPTPPPGATAPGTAARPPGPTATPGATATAPGTAARPPGAAAPAAGPGATAARPPGAAGPGAAARPPGAAAPAAGPGATAARPPPVVGPPAAKPAGAAPGAAQPRPPPQGAQAATPANAPGADEIPALRQLAMAMKQQDHFQRLGLTEQTNSAAVKVAYFRLAKLYHPDTLPQGAPQELEKLKAEVFAYIGDAYRTLSDDKSRAAYIEELKAGGGGSEVDVNAILQAEELFQKSCILVKARKFPEAVKMLDEAIRLNAEEAEFYAWRGYARFFMAADKKAAQPEAFREIQNAIKRNERCAPAHYFLGVIAKLCGDAPNALKHFKRTVELQPDHIDAQREIRMATQKK